MVHQPQQWRERFETDGYLVVPDMLPRQRVVDLRRRLEELDVSRDSLPESLRRHIHLERDYGMQDSDVAGESGRHAADAINNIMELPLMHQDFADLILQPELLDVLEVLFESREFRFHNYKCIVKAARISSPVDWHRDFRTCSTATPTSLLRCSAWMV